MIQFAFDEIVEAHRIMEESQKRRFREQKRRFWRKGVERETRLELATFCMASRCSTN